MSLSLQVKARVRETLKPRTSLESQNAWNLYGDIAWFGILVGIANSFLSVFVIRVGGSDTHVGLLSALPALIAIFVSIPGSRMVERERTPLSVLILTAILNRLGYLGIALVPFFLATNRADAIVALVALLTIPGAIANVAFTTMFGHAVKVTSRAHVVSIRNVWVGVTSMIASFVGGKVLDQILFPINYQILFAIAFLASMVSAYYLTRLRLPESQVASARTSASLQSIRDWIVMLRSSPAYSRFTLSSFIFHWGMFLPVPLYSIYWVRVLHASDGWVGLFNMVGTATTIVFYPLWGHLTVRRGNPYAIILATLGLASYPLATALSPSVEWIILVSFLGGAFSSGFGLTFFNRLLEVSPEQNRASYIASYNTLVNIAAFISPLIATALVAIFGIHLILGIGAILRLFGALLFWKWGAATIK